ncbi:carbohydrate ABC transporter permease [Clostridium gasigenes]|uniref:Carbohydrate ABC transporter membrane protein 2, CUT1 family n=1 Tax=Clostridium gasigenes TaxID=94869 RepID=A0A1H0TNJ2_9CLOT|nr:carbohydrate ABC transporter permease [Clostridium gasigenes]SDP55126.1 carbohydrate ABC transporter membrane protein 2, CUT1 family [Clostridium gasigenes]
MGEYKINNVIEVDKKSKKKKKLKTLTSYNFKTGILEACTWIFLILYLTPFYLIAINSLKTRREIFKNTTGFPEALEGQNYLQAIDKMNIGSAFFNSVIIIVCSVGLIVFFSSMAAWVLARDKSKKSKIIFYTFVAATIIPFQSVMLPLIKLMGKMNIEAINFNMLGTRYGLIFMYIGFGSSMSIFLYHGFIKSIPKDIEEAAIIDGCTKFQVYRKIIFPLLKPITVTVTVLNGIWIWNDFLLPFLTINGKINTIPLAMNNFFGAFSKQWELAMAGIVLSIIPMIIFYFFVQKYIIKGITQGSVK